MDDSGIMPLIDAELGPRPGPAGVPIRAVLVCLMVSIHHSGKAPLAGAWRLATFCLSAAAREQLGLDADRTPADDPHACLADNRRFYRAFDRLTTLLDPARHNRRTRLPQHEADLLATAWQDDDPDHARKRDLPQDIVAALVLTPDRWGKGRGYLAGFGGNVGIDTTAAPARAQPAHHARTGSPTDASPRPSWSHCSSRSPTTTSSTSGATPTSPKPSPSHPPISRRLQSSPSAARRTQARAGHHPPHKPQNPPPRRSAQPTVGFAMPNGRISLLRQRPDITRAFPDVRSEVPKPGRTRFGNP
ncbi:hypothetical protein [Streptosporangium canum]|uniref:hypothetical protein n=1 Tax=Streptosporangium canum TaxID=324952 RepID=UPI0033BAF513